MHGDPAPFEPLDRFPMVGLSGGVIADECPRTGEDPQRPVGPRCARSNLELLQRISCSLLVVASDRGLDEFGQGPAEEPHVVHLAGSPSTVESLLVVAEAVVKHRRHVRRQADCPSLTPGSGDLHTGFDQSGRHGLVASPGRQQQPAVAQTNAASGTGDPVSLGEQL